MSADAGVNLATPQWKLVPGRKRRQYEPRRSGHGGMAGVCTNASLMLGPCVHDDAGQPLRREVFIRTVMAELFLKPSLKVAPGLAVALLDAVLLNQL